MRSLTKINPPIQTLRQNEPNHAIFKTLFGPDLIEQFDVYRVEEVHNNSSNNHDNNNKLTQNEVLQVNIKLGTHLNGHPKIIHGGIIALLFDEAMGWARVVLTNNSHNVYVTANLNIDYRSPLKQDSEVLLRVFYVEGNEAKVRFRGVLENSDGVFAEAGGLFVRVRSKL